MGLFAVLFLGLAGWLIWTGRLQRMTAKDGMVLGAALVGAVMAAKGKPLIGAPLLVGATLFFFLEGQKGKTGRPGVKSTATPGADDIAKARALLGVGPDADAGQIRAAHRRLIASVHPDRGGTEALAAQLNAARDLLLARHAEQERAARR